MKDIVIKFTEEQDKKSKAEVSAVIDQEIEDFSQYMASIGNPLESGPLHPAERMLLKTYLVAKYTGKV